MNTQRNLPTRQIRDAYARRDAAGKTRLYAWNLPDVLLTQYRFRSVIASALSGAGYTDLGGRDCLDVGCGTGAWLRTLLEWGADAERLHGTDLLPDRIATARVLSPHIDWSVSEGDALPFEERSMDLVSAHMVFSSIPDPVARRDLAREMSRLLRTGGLILIYDFRISHPRNPDTVGIGGGEIRRLFPHLRHTQRSVTLAPPLQRPIARISPVLAHLAETLFPFLRSHALHLLRARQ